MRSSQQMKGQLEKKKIVLPSYQHHPSVLTVSFIFFATKEKA